jgi:hypothetical protein
VDRRWVRRGFWRCRLRTLWLVPGVVLIIFLSGSLLSSGASAAGASLFVSVSLSPTSIPADGVSTSVATATVSLDGQPLPGQTVTFSSSDGGIRFTPALDNFNGTYSTTLTSSTLAGSPSITASVQFSGGTGSGQAVLTQTPGPAREMSLSLQPPSIPANGASFTTATATVADAHGNPISTDPIVVSSSDPGERILPVANGGNGTYSTMIRSSTTPGPVAIQATDTATNLSVRAELTQTPLSQTASDSLMSLVTMQWTFRYAPTDTRVVALTVSGAPLGASVLIRCRGRGCAFGQHRQTVGAKRQCGVHRRRPCRTGGVINLAPYFHQRSVPARARITVAVTRPLWTGKYYEFDLRPGRAPRVRISCLAPGAVRPGGPC